MDKKSTIIYMIFILGSSYSLSGVSFWSHPFADVIDSFLNNRWTDKLTLQLQGDIIFVFMHVWCLCSWHRLLRLMSSRQKAIPLLSEHCVLCVAGWVLLMLLPCCSHRSRPLPALLCLSATTQELQAAGGNPLSFSYSCSHRDVVTNTKLRESCYQCHFF